MSDKPSRSRLRRVALAGAIFGGAAASSAVAVASWSGSRADNESDAVASPFSTSELDIYTSEPVDLPVQGDMSTIDSILGNDAQIFYAGSDSSIEVYIAHLSDESVCLVVYDEVGVGSTCGSKEFVESGRLVLRSQLYESSPAMFVGVAPNDLNSAEVGGTKATFLHNAWVAVADPSADTYTIGSEAGDEVVVTL